MAALVTKSGRAVGTAPKHPSLPDGKPSDTVTTAGVASKPAPSTKRPLSSPGPEPPAARPKPTVSIPKLPGGTAGVASSLTPTEADGC